MSPQQDENLRHTGYFVVALAGLIAGMILGFLSAQTEAGSRIKWPERSTLFSNHRAKTP